MVIFLKDPRHNVRWEAVVHLKQRKPQNSQTPPVAELPLKQIGLIATFLGVVVFSLYVKTGSPTLISCGDSAELTAAAASFGVAHAPGYPLFTLGGGIFSLLTPHSPAWGVHLFNALSGTLAVVCLFLILLLLTRQPVPAIAGALTLAFSYHFWLYAHVPEIAALNAFFFGLIVLSVLLLFQSFRANEKEIGPDPKKLYWLAFLMGLAFSHHHSMVFMGPGVLIGVIAWAKKQKTPLGPKEWLAVGGFLVLGLTPYLYVPLRAHAMPYMNAGTVTAFSRFFDHLTRRAYGVTALTPEYTPFNEPALDSVLAFYGLSLLKSFSGGGIVIGLWGLGVLLWKSPRTFLVIGISGFLAGPFFLAWAGMPATTVVLKTILERFFVASFYLFAVGIGVGMAYLTDRLKRNRAGKAYPQSMAALALVLAVALPAALLARNFHRLNFSAFDLCERYGRDLLRFIPPQAVLFVHGDNSLFSLWYLQRLSGVRPDVKILNANISPPYADHVRVHYPDLGFDPGVTPSLKEVIAENFGKFRLFLVGVPGNEFQELGVLGNPYVLRPSGLAFEIVRKVNPEEDPEGWGSREGAPSVPAALRDTFFVEEILYLYTIGHYNRAIIHATQGHFRAAYDASQMALAVDPHFELARALRDRMAQKGVGPKESEFGPGDEAFLTR